MFASLRELPAGGLDRLIDATFPVLYSTAPVDASQAPQVVWSSISAIFENKKQPQAQQ